MKSKKFFILALAAAVLFSFAACQPTFKTVIGMTATTTKADYLIGQPVDLSSVNVTVRYSDGSSDEFTGDEVTYHGPSEITADTTLTFSYGSIDLSDPTLESVSNAATVRVFAHSPASVALANLPTTGTINGADAVLDYSGVTATVKDAEGNTYEVSGSALNITTSMTVAAGEQAATVTKVGIYDKSVTSPSNISGDENWKVTLSAASSTTYDETKFSEIEVTVEYYDSEDNKQDKPWIGDTAKLVVKAKDTNGNISGEIEYGETVGTNYTATVDVSAGIAVTDKEQSITITLVQKGVIKQKTVKVLAGDDYVKSLDETTAVSLVDPDKKYDGGKVLPISDLKIKYTMAGATEATEVSGDKFPGSILVLGNIPANDGDSEATRTVNLLISYGKDNKEVVAEEINVTVNPTGTGA